MAGVFLVKYSIDMGWLGPAVRCGLGVVSGMALMVAGEWLRTRRSASEKLIGLFVSGSLAAAAGMVFSWFFPLNKNLWTSSYVVLTAGLALISLAVIYYFVDLKGQDGWAKPFYVFGTNSIAVFVLSGLLAKILYKVRWTSSLTSSSERTLLTKKRVSGA